MKATQHNRKLSNEKYILRWLDEISERNRSDSIAFLELKLAQGVKSGSRVHYARALAAFDQSLNGKAWNDVDELDAARFLAAMRTARYSDDVLRTTAAVTKHFLKWIRGTGELPYRLMLAFRVRRNRNLPERPILTQEQERLLLDASPTLRDQVMVGLLLEGGYRVNELVNLNVGGVAFDDKGGAWLSLPAMEEGLKTGPRRVYIAKYANLLHAYLSLHPDRDVPESPLLLSYDNRRRVRGDARIGTSGVWLALGRLQRKTGIQHFRPHDMRHTAITRASESGIDPIALSERFWGIRNSRQAATYVHQSDEHRERMARRAAGIDELGQPLGQGLVECPACAEPIKSAAKKCKHCGEFVSARLSTGGEKLAPTSK